MPRVKVISPHQINTAVVSVGSNIAPKRHIAMARKMLAKNHCLIKASPFCKTKPIGLAKQPDYRNGAFLIRTTKNLRAFKKELKEIEKKVGRDDRQRGNNPRTIDLDIIVWNNTVIHKDFFERDFVQKAVFALISPALLKTVKYPNKKAESYHAP